MSTPLPEAWTDARSVIGERLDNLEEHRHQVSVILPDVVRLVVALHAAIGRIQESMEQSQKEISQAAQISERLTERVAELERVYDIDHVDV